MSTYKTNYLSDVLLRLDYEAPIDALQIAVPDALDRSLLKDFSIKEINSVISQQFNIDFTTDKIIKNNANSKELNYYANEKKKRICISNSYFYIHFKQYISFDDLMLAFKIFLEYAKINYHETKIKRIGLRYINQIPASGDILKWEDYINPAYIGTLSLLESGHEISRALTVLNLNISDKILSIQAGMPNPEYPASIKRKVFTLDYDASMARSVEFKDVDAIINDLHSIIETYFGKSITDALKAKLNE